MKKIFISTLVLSLLSFSSLAAQGVVNVRSAHSVEVTANNLEKVLLSKGMKIFQRIKHSAGAKKVGVDLRPTELIIFGNPKVGSPLMKCAQTVAIDLPQKALIWQDEDNAVWISYNDPEFLKFRHTIEGCDKVLNKVTGALAKMTAAAAK